jgi:hypothetical protein
VGCTTGSKGEVPGESEPVIRDDDDDDDDDGWRRRPPDMESICKYAEKAVANNRQGVVLQVGGWAMTNSSSPQRKKSYEMLH